MTQYLDPPSPSWWPAPVVSNACVTGWPVHSAGMVTPRSQRTVAAVSVVRMPKGSGVPPRTPSPHTIQGIVGSSGALVPWVHLDGARDHSPHLNAALAQTLNLPGEPLFRNRSSCHAASAGANPRINGP